MQLCVYGICLDEFYIGARCNVFYEFYYSFSSSMEKHMTMSWEKEREWRKKNEKRKKEGGEKKRNIKRIVRKKRRGEVWAITTWLELQRTPSLLGIPLDPVTKGNDPRFLASKPDHHVFLRVYSISLSTIRGTVYDPTHCVLCITWKACQDWIPRYLWERKSRRVGMSMLIWKKFRQEMICKRFSN